MGRKLPPDELELYKRCDEVLHYIWDPIGICDTPDARDEYFGYLPQVFALIRDQAAPDEVVSYLLEVEEKRLGLRPDPERALRTVRVLRDWRKRIYAPRR